MGFVPAAVPPPAAAQGNRGIINKFENRLLERRYT